jgi:hypothetical protein
MKQTTRADPSAHFDPERIVFVDGRARSDRAWARWLRGAPTRPSAERPS